MDERKWLGKTRRSDVLELLNGLSKSGCGNREVKEGLGDLHELLLARRRGLDFELGDIEHCLGHLRGL